MTYDAAKVAAEITLLINERHIDPNIIIDHTYLSSYADGTVPLPFGNATAMLVLAHTLRTEPWYWYNLAGMPNPPETDRP
jgi:hypothetical protein